mmetsp:Transcript_49415/g.75191  ORF Transcript_49415/g.75191 Transcript_49415/m.75191 type:complete len:186 (-) Transcript_49415:296-853(-)
MARFPHIKFEVNWRPFQLNPNNPKEGANKMEEVKKKYGEAAAARMLPRITQVFQDLGIPFKYGGNTCNTFDSHRLAAWALTQGRDKQDALMEELFKKYFCEEQSLSREEVLLEAVGKAGLDKEEAGKVIADENAFKDDVNEQKKKFGRGVSGVPFFVFNGLEGVSGAQPPEVLAQIFEELEQHDN